MPRWTTLLATAIALCLCSGCIVQSIHPLYTDADRLFDPGLVGSWGTEKSAERFKFSSDDQLSYTMTYVDEKGHGAQLSARLVVLDGVPFMDLFACEPSSDENVLAIISLVPVHTLWKCERTGDVLRLSPASMQWLNDYVHAHPGELAYEMAAEPVEKEWPLITASTEQLRAFVIKHMHDDGLFDPNSDADALRRMPDAP
jgi:hypothetical protein